MASALLSDMRAAGEGEPESEGGREGSNGVKSTEGIEPVERSEDGLPTPQGSEPRTPEAPHAPRQDSDKVTSKGPLAPRQEVHC